MLGRLSLIFAFCVTAPAQSVLDLLDGETLYQDGSLVTIAFDVERRDDLRRGTSRLGDPVHGFEREIRTTVGYQYGLRNDLQLGAALSWVELDRETTAGDLTGNGLGDLELLGKWRFFRWDAKAVALNVSALATLSLPVGADDERAGGVRLEPELQPGSGGLDPGVGLAATHEPGRWRFNAAALYRFRTDTDDDGWRRGDELVTELSVGNRFWLEPYPGPFMRADVGVRYEREASSRAAGMLLPGTGAERALVAFNLAFRPRPSLDFQVGVDVPVWQRVEGVQYGDDWAARFSFGFRF